MDSIHILIWWYGVLFSFLRNNEWIALWVEGLALVAIFFWGRKDAKADHEETLEQIRLTRQQIESSQNSERAWLVAELVPICAQFSGQWCRPIADGWIRLTVEEPSEREEWHVRYSLLRELIDELIIAAIGHNNKVKDYRGVAEVFVRCYWRAGWCYTINEHPIPTAGHLAWTIMTRLCAQPPAKTQGSTPLA
jgi:hypothetical protein